MAIVPAAPRAAPPTKPAATPKPSAYFGDNLPDNENIPSLRGSNLFWKTLLLVVYPGTAWEWGPPVCPVARSPVTIFRSTRSGIAAHWTARLWKGRVLSLSEVVPLEHSLLGLGNRTSTSHPAWGGSPWTRAAARSWPSSPGSPRSPAAQDPSPTTLTGLAKNSSFAWNQFYEKKSCLRKELQFVCFFKSFNFINSCA